MLSPITPTMLPVATQPDPVVQRPVVPAVAPVQQTSAEDAVALDRRHPQETEELLREEQRRRQRRRAYSAAELAEGNVDEADAEAVEALPRQGLWVDVEV
ncbi:MULTISPECIES: aspartate-semialdehyde dehydrogenase [Pseudomonas]|uniref:Aspartate-semialdehyde dehydrogenase n=1 Tax=Pseudomonas kuykendallii TaxID=1007099 RepID=A0A2W5ESN1_9PSED|nr:MULTISPECIES: aspartate-semialdehyde dehydrogenase [Pseudomonas]PZP23076.1 MAG: aspartate-semialdehyde dehydrogenase [Pseudomonas kuykendallii]